MNLNEYQEQRGIYAVYKKKGENEGLYYAVLALCGESGELANKLKKSIRSETPADPLVLADELGDVLWYVAATATELGMTLEEVARMNLAKLAARRQAAGG